ncbi:AurF N-oxygenase family protein [Thiohalorhabdus sp.]|uniref:AurF N-oxygenase family protein n=1 Tax=Thiohalorhabdus sp. TaxID=3094134 RepID=UPI002FC3D657
MTRIANLPSLSDRLSASSAEYRDPLAQVDWATLDPQRPWMPEEMVSLYGLPEWEGMSEVQRRHLGQCELIAFLELGLWLEALFMQRIARRASEGPGGDLAGYTYQLHELREEAGHSLMFVELIRRSRIPPLVSRLRRPRMATAFARLAPFDSAAFWATILIGEAVPDQMNRILSRDEALPEAVRQVMAVHMREEARHIAYARSRVGERLAGLSWLRRRALGLLVRRVLGQFIDQCFYPPAAVYAQAGLANPGDIARRARANPHRAQVVRRCVGPTVDYLADSGLSLGRSLPGPEPSPAEAD